MIRPPGRNRVLGYATAVLLVPALAVAQAQPRGQNTLAGARVFGSAGCVACHSVNGMGGTIGPDLSAVSEGTSFFGLAATLWNHLPAMQERMAEFSVARPRLDSWEMGDLLAFLHSLGYFDNPGDVDTGRALFREKSCIRCHRVEGVGGVLGPNLDFLSQYDSPIQVASAMWNHGPSMSQAMAAAGIERPGFSSQQLRDLIAFLRASAARRATEMTYVLPGREDAGRRFFAEQRCIECHGLRQREGKIGPALAGAGRHSSVLDLAAAMWNAAPAMQAAMRNRGVPIPEIGPGDMADLVAYFYSVQYFPEERDQVRGRALLTTKGCLDCHSHEGRGAVVAADLSTVNLVYPAGLMAGLWNHTLLAESEGRRRWPEFTASQMADLAFFLQETRSNR